MAEGYDEVDDPSDEHNPHRHDRDHQIGPPVGMGVILGEDEDNRGVHDVVNNNPELERRIENALVRDQRVLRTFTQPRGVIDQMAECGIRTLLRNADGGELSNDSDNDFFDSVD